MANVGMNENNKKIPRMLLTLSIAILPISMLSVAPIVMAIGADTSTTVTRTLSTTSPTPGSTFDVMLNITKLQIGGIVETIPDDFAFVSTAHPSNQTDISGQKVVFALVNETVIKYKVQASSEAEGSMTFSGTWYDALNEAEGNIGSTSVSVSATEIPTPSPAITPAHAHSPPVPGFEAVFAVAGFFAVAVLVSFRRKGGEVKERE